MLRVNRSLNLMTGFLVLGLSISIVSKAGGRDEDTKITISGVSGALGLAAGIPAWLQISGVSLSLGSGFLPIAVVVTGAAGPVVSIGVTVVYNINGTEGTSTSKCNQRYGALLDRARSEAMEVIAMREIEADQQDAFPVTLREFIGITRQTLKEDAKASVYESLISDQDLVDGIASGQIQVQI